jgi:Transposase DDE domain
VSSPPEEGTPSIPVEVCAVCPLRSRCTSSLTGSYVTIGPDKELLAAGRADQTTPAFKAIYNRKRPTVERVISGVVRNGGRKATIAAGGKVLQQLTLKVAAENLLGMLRLRLTWRNGRGLRTRLSEPVPRRECRSHLSAGCHSCRDRVGWIHAEESAFFSALVRPPPKYIGRISGGRQRSSSSTGDVNGPSC